MSALKPYTCVKCRQATRRPALVDLVVVCEGCFPGIRAELVERCRAGDTERPWSWEITSFGKDHETDDLINPDKDGGAW